METLESRLTQAQQLKSEAETKAKRFEELLKKAQEPPGAPPPPPLPPPPPPPPAPSQLLKKFVGIVSSGGKRGLKKTKSGKSIKEDPRVKAMSEMMERIKNGKVELKKTIPRQASTPSPVDVEGEGSAMDNLRDVLKSIKPSPSKDDNGTENEDEKKSHTFGVHLRKPAERKPRSLSDSNDPESNFRSMLRKPRSHSTGDMLDDEGDTGQTMDQDLYKLLQKQKAAAERDEKAEKQQNHTEKEQQAGKTREEKGQTL
ncbi:shootin-1-like isoform X1 [Paramuricea clavata]|uniref:Shootin-1-like isoform X1 n=2 Tax=Paramuricea clavata TaxID=317549 RepID=A0A7D9KX67_PARCT|nr:shootin-1-like isoform X1 [Paramuricea clavata]